MVNSRCKGKIFLADYKMKNNEKPLPFVAASLATGKGSFWKYVR